MSHLTQHLQSLKDVSTSSAHTKSQGYSHTIMRSCVELPPSMRVCERERERRVFSRCATNTEYCSSLNAEHSIIQLSSIACSFKTFLHITLGKCSHFLTNCWMSLNKDFNVVLQCTIRYLRNFVSL
jgi:hypothetical protein